MEQVDQMMAKLALDNETVPLEMVEQAIEKALEINRMDPESEERPYDNKYKARELLVG